MAKKSNVYTRTGDDGTTALVGGRRVSKSSVKLDSYGTIDELNSHLGLLLTYVAEPIDKEHLLRCQCNLFTIGALLATDAESGAEGFPQAEVEALERAIDQAHEGLPPWRGFTLPGGSRAAAEAHVCRTVCRRAERIICILAHEERVDPQLMAYVNRLSDYLYVLACRFNHLSGVEENLWRKNSVI